MLRGPPNLPGAARAVEWVQTTGMDECQGIEAAYVEGAPTEVEEAERTFAGHGEGTRFCVIRVGYSGSLMLQQSATLDAHRTEPATAPRVLVAEDEADVLASVVYGLRHEGFEVDAFLDGETALRAAESNGYDLVVLDVLMPGLSGLSVCQRVRERSIVPIIMLTARDREIDRVLGLELGADDYVTKPFSLAELASRVRSLLRRVELDRRAGAEPPLRVGTLRIDRASHRASLNGDEVRLTHTEFKLISLLATHPGRTFSRDHIMRHLWNGDYDGDQRACDVHVSNLRRKLEDDSRRPRRIVTVRDIGYRLEAA